MTKIGGSGSASGSIRQTHGSADPIQIHTKMSWIRNTASQSIKHVLLVNTVFSLGLKQVIDVVHLLIRLYPSLLQKLPFSHHIMFRRPPSQWFAM
jgi:hypothetical protein